MKSMQLPAGANAGRLTAIYSTAWVLFAGAFLANRRLSATARLTAMLVTTVTLGASYLLWRYNDHCIARGDRDPNCRVFSVAIVVFLAAGLAASSISMWMAVSSDAGARGRGRK